MLAASTSTPSRQIPPPPRASRDKSKVRAEFYALIDAGYNQAQAARNVQVTPNTASAWVKARKSADSAPSKDSLVMDLARAFQAAPVQNKSNIASRLIELLGYKQREAEASDAKPQLPMSQLFERWNAERQAAVLAAAAPPPSPDPPSAALSESLGPTQPPLQNLPPDTAPTTQLSENAALSANKPPADSGQVAVDHAGAEKSRPGAA